MVAGIELFAKHFGRNGHYGIADKLQKLAQEAEKEGVPPTLPGVRVIEENTEARPQPDRKSPVPVNFDVMGAMVDVLVALGPQNGDDLNADSGIQINQAILPYVTDETPLESLFIPTSGMKVLLLKRAKVFVPRELVEKTSGIKLGVTGSHNRVISAFINGGINTVGKARSMDPHRYIKNTSDNSREYISRIVAVPPSNPAR